MSDITQEAWEKYKNGTEEELKKLKNEGKLDNEHIIKAIKTLKGYLLKDEIRKHPFYEQIEVCINYAIARLTEELL